MGLFGGNGRHSGGTGGGRFGGRGGSYRNGSGSGAVLAGQTIWQPIIDAAESMHGTFSDPVAMEGVNALDSAADCVASVGQAFKLCGQTVLDSVRIDPRVQAAYEEMGDYIMAAEDRIRDAATSVRNAHQEQIEAIEENDPRDRAWDLTQHDDLR
jgi:hypothetical protein